MSRPAQIAPVEGGGSLVLAWRIQGQTVLVVGGGAVAAGRVVRALEADGRVVLVAPEINAELTRRVELGEIEWRPRRFEFADLDGVGLVMTAIDDHEVSRQIAEACRARRIPVNVADVPDLCDFWFASMVREGPLQIAISTNGMGPAIGSRLARELSAWLPEEIGPLLKRFGAFRQRIRKETPQDAASGRRMGWLGRLGRTWPYEALRRIEGAVADRLIDAYRRGDPPPDGPGGLDEAPHLTLVQGEAAGLGRETAFASGGVPQPPQGRVTLVGGGLGDPDLLTVAARRALEQADLVVADRLIAPEILALVQGELRIARKYPGRSEVAQAELEALLIEGARAGRHVVRLKAGDPFLFGRGGEELEVLAAQGIEAEVIPGISSALAGPLTAGVPVTMRGDADRLLIMTGQTAGGGWPELPMWQANTTLVLLMAVGRAGRLAEGLIARGFPADLPVSIVERASRPDQRDTWCVLSELGETVAREAIRAPAVITIGSVAALPARLEQIRAGALTTTEAIERTASMAGGL